MVFINCSSPQEYEENSFTGLFSLLKQYRLSQEKAILAFNKNDVQLIHQYSEDGIKVLLQGLQDVGFLLATQNKNTKYQINIGFFISAVTNLIEALDDLRSDINFMLNNKCNFTL